MIEDMVDPLKTEQQEDADKKEYCEMQLDTAEDKKKFRNMLMASRRLALHGRRSPLHAEESLLEDTKFLANLEKNSATNEKAWAIIARFARRSPLARADTSWMRKDDGALDFFKETLAGSSASFVQMQVSSAAGARSL